MSHQRKEQDFMDSFRARTESPKVEAHTANIMARTWIWCSPRGTTSMLLTRNRWCLPWNHAQMSPKSTAKSSGGSRAVLVSAPLSSVTRPEWCCSSHFSKWLRHCWEVSPWEGFKPLHSSTADFWPSLGRARAVPTRCLSHVVNWHFTASPMQE